MFYLIAIGAVVLAFAGLFAHDRIQTGRLDSAQASTRIANSRADDAEGANTTLRASVVKVEAEAKACSDATDAFMQKAVAAEKRATDAIADKAKANAAARIAVDSLRERAKTAMPKSKELACQEADTILSDLSRDVRKALGLVEITGPYREPPK